MRDGFIGTEQKKTRLPQKSNLDFYMYMHSTSCLVEYRRSRLVNTLTITPGFKGVLNVKRLTLNFKNFES